MTKTAKAAAKAVSLAPAGDRFLVRYVKRDRVTPGGIYVPETVKESTIHGTVTAVVLAVGPGRLLDNGEFVRTVDANAGDRVLLDSVHSACWLEDPEDPTGKGHVHLINAIDVLAVLR